MDIFKGHYFNLNRKLLTSVGLWPYATERRKVIRSVIMVLIFSQSIPHILSAIIHYENKDRMMLGLLAALTSLLGLSVVFALIMAENKLKRLFGSIANNWQAIRDVKEREILVEYSERARIVTILYSVSISSVCIAGLVVPLIPKILDKINPLEESRPNILLLGGEFFVDREKYFSELYFCDSILIVLITNVTIAVDTMYMVSAEHSCAMNAIISYRLRNLDQKSLDNSSAYTDHLYSKVVDIVELHQKTISFISTVSESFSLIILFTMATNLLAIPLDACAILAHLHDPINMGPFAMFFVALTFHLLVIFWPGQRILDHNLRLCDDAYANEWYTLPLRTKKLLLIFMLRCSEPASLSAEGLFLINFETFSLVMRTAISYITVLASFR